MTNINFLANIPRRTLLKVIREIYYFERKPNIESMGDIQLTFEGISPIIFRCNNDSESLEIHLGEFSPKREFTSELPQYEWKYTEFLSNNFIETLGPCSTVEIDYIIYPYQRIPAICRFYFSSKTFFCLWTTESDNIHYGLNLLPDFSNKMLEFETEIFY